MGDNNNFLLFYISSSEKINMVVKILDETPIDLENESFVARQSRQSQSPLAEVLAAEYPESLPVH